MEEWKEYKLGDLCNIFTGKKDVNQTTSDGLYPFFSCAPTPYKSKDYLYDGEAIIVAGNGSFTGRVSSYIGKFDLYQRTYACVPIMENFDFHYLYYYMKACFEPKFMGGTRGSSIPYIVKGDLLDFIVALPSLTSQRIIANILKSLDDKIEVNRRINENVEQQARALFKSWFVDFEPFKDGEFVESELGMIPEGWRVGTLFDVAEIFDKQRKPLSGKEREGMKRLYPYYGATSCMDYVDNYLFDGIYTLIGEDGSVAKEDGLPYMQYVWGKFWVNNHAHILQGKNGFSTEMIYVLLSITNIQHLVTGAVQAKLSQANMQKIVLAIPPMIVLNQVRPIIDSMYETRRERENESRRLAELRDTLLPRLMSGEININEIENKI